MIEYVMIKFFLDEVDSIRRSSEAGNNSTITQIGHLKIRNDTFNELIKLETTYIQRLQSIVNVNNFRFFFERQ